MITMFKAFIVVCLAILCLCIFFFYRNNKVYEFRQYLLAQVDVGSASDISRRVDFHWRFDKLDLVSYNTMLYTWWRPLKAEEWWVNTSFLEEEGTE